MFVLIPKINYINIKTACVLRVRIAFVTALTTNHKVLIFSSRYVSVRDVRSSFLGSIIIAGKKTN